MAKEVVETFLPSCNHPTLDTDTLLPAADAEKADDRIPIRSRVASNDKILHGDCLLCAVLYLERCR